MNEDFNDETERHLPPKFVPLTLDDIRHMATLNVDQASQVMSMSKASMYRALKRGDIPSIMIGRSLRIPVQPLLKLLGAI